MPSSSISVFAGLGTGYSVIVPVAILISPIWLAVLFQKPHRATVRPERDRGRAAVRRGDFKLRRRQSRWVDRSQRVVLLRHPDRGLRRGDPLGCASRRLQREFRDRRCQ